MELAFTLNGEQVTLADVDDEMLLVDVLRSTLGLTGTKRGCESGACGACSVLVDDKLTKSCRLPVAKVAGRAVITIEGLHAPDGGLSDLQQAFLECGAVQCGYCTPGMLMAAKALLDRNPRPSREDVVDAISGNLCRCTGYEAIITAIMEAAGASHNQGRA